MKLQDVFLKETERGKKINSDLDIQHTGGKVKTHHSATSIGTGKVILKM